MGCYTSIPKTSDNINVKSNIHTQPQKNTAYQIGDKVVCKLNSKPLRGTISAIDSRNKRIEVSFDTLRQRGYFKIGTSFQDQANKFIEKPRSQQQRTVSLSESLSSENTSYINKVQDIKKIDTKLGKATATRGDESRETYKIESISKSEVSMNQNKQLDVPLPQTSNAGLATSANQLSRPQTSTLPHPQPKRKRRRKRRRRRKLKRTEITGRELEEMMRIDAEIQREREARKPPPKVYTKILKSPSKPRSRLDIKSMHASSYEPQEVGLDGRTLLIDPVYIRSGVIHRTSNFTALLGPDRAYYCHGRGGWQEYLHWIETMTDHHRNTIRDTRGAELFERLHPAHRNSPSPSPSYDSDYDY